MIVVNARLKRELSQQYRQCWLDARSMAWCLDDTALVPPDADGLAARSRRLSAVAAELRDALSSMLDEVERMEVSA